MWGQCQNLYKLVQSYVSYIDKYFLVVFCYTFLGQLWATFLPPRILSPTTPITLARYMLYSSILLFFLWRPGGPHKYSSRASDPRLPTSDIGRYVYSNYKDGQVTFSAGKRITAGNKPCHYISGRLGPYCLLRYFGYKNLHLSKCCPYILLMDHHDNIKWR